MIVDGFSEGGYTCEPEFFTKIFGDNGCHARFAVGVVLPSNWPVEVDLVAAVR